MVIRINEPERWYKIDNECRGGMTSQWKKIRLHILERDSYRCVYCGNSEGALHVDHVFPRSRGGSDNYTNLVCACAKCNMSKGDKTPEEWGWYGS